MWQWAIAGSGTWNTFAHTASATPSITITGLTAGTSYDYRTAAVNVNGQSASYSTVTTGSTAAASANDDNFNRADAATPGGSGWTLSSTGGTPTAGIESNRLYLNGGTGTPAAAFLTRDLGSATQDVSVTLAVLGSAPLYSGLVVRYVDSDNYVVMQADAAIGTATSYGLYQKVAGAYTAIGASIAVAPSAADTIRVVCNGTTYTPYVNGTSQGARTASPSGAINAATRAGITSGTGGSGGSTVSTVRFDNFAAA